MTAVVSERGARAVACPCAWAGGEAGPNLSLHSEGAEREHALPRRRANGPVRTPCTLPNSIENDRFKSLQKVRTIHWRNGYPGYHLRFSRSTQSAGGPGPSSQNTSSPSQRALLTPRVHHGATRSLRKAHFRAARELRQEGKGPESRPKHDARIAGRAHTDAPTIRGVVQARSLQSSSCPPSPSLITREDMGSRVHGAGGRGGARGKGGPGARGRSPVSQCLLDRARALPSSWERSNVSTHAKCHFAR